MNEIQELKKKLGSFFHDPRTEIGDENGDYCYEGVENVKEISVLLPNPMGKFKKFFFGIRFKRPMILMVKINVKSSKEIILGVYGQQNLPWAEEQQEKLEKRFSKSKLKVSVKLEKTAAVFCHRRVNLTKAFPKK